MGLTLYINGQQADLDAGQAIAQTKQVNDINSLENRQAGYTNKFRLPKTANNIRIMEFLALPGNNSTVPYRHNECSLYGESGQCFIYRGRAVITDAGDNYEAVVYDGIIDLYKAIENKTLADVEIAGIDHVKTVETVKASWTDPSLNYRYILADYNGDNGPADMGMVNIDYQAPSVKVSYIWRQIFATFGFGYSGSIFDSPDFQNLWMTFPKGLSAGDAPVDMFSSSDIGYEASVNGHIATYYIGYPSYDTFALNGLIQNRHMVVPEAGYYRVEVSGKLKTRSLVFNKDKKAKVYIGKNSLFMSPGSVIEAGLIKDNIPSNSDFEGSCLIQLDANESICVLFGIASQQSPEWGFHLAEAGALSVKLVKINESDYSFGAAFGEFSVRDFLTEVVHRFGLTLFKRKYENHYEFMTLQEQLRQAPIENWSGKLAGKVSESYVYGNYARRNWMRYSYNDSTQNHYDGYIDVANVNLPDTRDIIKSKIYSPERKKSTLLNRAVNVYKLWDKELVENPEEGEKPYTYKSLDKRFYFLRSERVNSGIGLYSDQMGDGVAAVSYFIGKATNLSFREIIKNYYLPMRQLLEKSRIITAELLLSEADIANFDFRKLYYLEQFASCFLVNKIINYVPGRPSKCELIRIENVAEAIAVPPPIKITKIIVSNYAIVIYYDLNTDAETINLWISHDNQQTWYNTSMGAGNNPWYQSFSGTDTYFIKLQAGAAETPVIEIAIPGNQTLVFP